MPDASATTQAARALLAVCVAASVAGLLQWVFPGRRALGWIVDALGAACLLTSLAAFVLRWSDAGHLPLFGTYESSLSLAVAILATAAIVRLRTRQGAAGWLTASIITAGVLAHGMTYDPTIYALTISERSWVVDVHAIVAWVAFGAFALSAGIALQILFRRVDVEVGERRLVRSLVVCFALHTAMLASGSFYKFLLFGRAWSFDPIETLGFVAWVAYGGLLHMHYFSGWEGRRLAAWSAALFVILVVAYRGIVYFPAWSTYHIFDMDLRMHVGGSDGPPGGGGP